jgi:peptidoglycan/xylan/chitin deacetylase (PgdA/CDA1 family)
MAAKGLLGFASRSSRVFGTGRAVILKYHSVLAAPDVMRPGEVTADEFDTQMRVVAASFPTRTFGEWLSGRAAGRRQRNAVIVTFDDGYKDNHDVALPILRKHGVAATVFVASGYLAGGMMFNDRLLEALRAAVGRTVDLREAGLGQVALDTPEQASRTAAQALSAIKRWPQDKRASFVDELARAGSAPHPRIMMNAGEVRALADAGVEIGAHTVSHPILSKVSAEDAWTEISESKKALEAVTGRAVRTFAYPNGRPDKDFTLADVQRVKEAGYLGAVTTRWACATPGADAFLVPRQGIWGKSRMKLWLQLLRNFRA